MPRSVTHLLLALAIGTANLSTVHAIHDCSMTGRRSMTSCCCDSPANYTPPSCCKSNSPEPADRDSTPALRSLCCSITFEKSATVVCSRGLLDAGWKHVLSGARLSPALTGLPSAIDSPLRSRVDRRCVGDGLRALTSQPPIFILHCALLL
ncbi:MAG TPA: hypothetical protein VMT52_04740 [Planctomycetota bacterium]|nr:hypothetical protein [Planctomycetota bacterium]